MATSAGWGRARTWSLAAASVGLVGLFVALADEVLLDADTARAHAIDVGVLEAVDRARSPAVTAFARAITTFGSGWLLMVVVAGGTALLAWRRDRAGAILLGGAGAGAFVGELALKAAFGRARPDTIAWLVDASGNSFPSGHSIGAASIYLAAAILLGRAAPAGRRLAILLAAGVFIVTVGLSRVYLGVHWPSDVLGGLCVGAAWTLALTAAVRFHDARRKRPLG